MAGFLLGSAQQLVTIFRRHFVLAGNPPSGSEWRFPCSPDVVILPKTRKERREFDALGVISSEMDRVNEYGSLLGSDSWLIRDAIEYIPPIRDVAVVMRDIASELTSHELQSTRFAYLFLRLCKKGRLFSSLGQGGSFSFEDDSAEYYFSVTLCCFGSETLNDLEASVRELHALAPGKPTIAPVVPHDLTTTEHTIIQAIGSQVLNGQEVARIAGFNNNSSFRGKLSTLVKRGVLEKIAGEGYRLKHVTDNRLTSQ